MSKALIIVESPAKIKTLKKFLGGKFNILSSIGHIRDLPAKEFGIDVEKTFDPVYVNLPDKAEVIKKLQKAAKEADIVYLSPDPDREGEAIAWHIASILPKKTHIKRMTFNSLTKDAVLQALKEPRDIDLALVNAQQARRMLDRIVGYKISPILNRKIKRGRLGTSAGRVQSVALKLVVDREKEIESFVPVEYWNILASLAQGKKTKPFDAQIFSVNGKKVEKEAQEGKDFYLIPSVKEAKKIEQLLKEASYKVGSVERKEKKRYPVPPFITSTLQQEASRHYGFAVSRTMSIAQSLYEGIDMGKEGTEGLITYMRTDSVVVAPEAISSARAFIAKKFGKNYLPEKPNYYTSKKSAQEAHEAIRPTNLEHPPEKVQKYLNADQYKIYLLIWRRFIASQMTPAIYDTMSIEVITDKKILLHANGSVIKFSGFLSAYEEKTDYSSDEKEGMDKILPSLEEGELLQLREVTSTQAFTKPPARFTEASLVKELEKSGIGRPSTYASIMNKIQSREYTLKENNTLKPTELGKIIAFMMEENFRPIMDIGFTAAMEDDLELVAENKRNWKELIKEFWKEFIPMVEKAEKEATVPKLPTDLICPKCHKPLQKIWSKNKYFYGCSNYPTCDFTSSVQEMAFKKSDYAEDFNWNQKCPKCQKPMVVRHGKYGAFLGCSSYPDCKGIVAIPKKGEVTVAAKDLPDCPALGCDGKIIQRRSRWGKFFFSCSNFPDCDVIANDLDALEKKYDASHPKTAYQKPQKGKNNKYPKKLYTPSKDLAEIIGKEKLTRGEVMKKIWEYIKKHKLQDRDNKRTINPDANLAKILGKEPLDMMKMGSFLKLHLM